MLVPIDRLLDKSTDRLLSASQEHSATNIFVRIMTKLDLLPFDPLHDDPMGWNLLLTACAERLERIARHGVAFSDEIDDIAIAVKVSDSESLNCIIDLHAALLISPNQSVSFNLETAFMLIAVAAQLKQWCVSEPMIQYDFGV